MAEGQDPPVEPNSAPAPQGKFAGMPYDFRKPTLTRARSRLWNAQDSRLFTPKSFGLGYDVNFYWLVHPLQYIAKHRAPKA